jgi:membrane protease YdiL (CAAX protease family)
MTLVDHTKASGCYRAETPWGPWPATFAALVVVALSLIVPITATIAFDFADRSRSGPPDPAILAGWGPLLLSQSVMLYGAIWLASRWDARPTAVLALRPEPLPVSWLTLYFLVIGLTSLAYTLVVFAWQPEIVVADMETFRPLVQSSAWPIYALIIIVGAPLSEELLFRGFLQSALSASRIGYIGASVVTTILWASLHFQYSIFGIAEIVVVGFSLCWVLHRIGTLWATVILHGLYNGAQFAGMRLGLFPWS